MKVIFAIDYGNGYAKENEIPWNNKEDMKHFKEKTTNNIVIMGHNTWKSLPIKPLPNRINIVVSTTYENKNINPHIVCKSLLEAYEYTKEWTNKDTYVIGGSNLIYEALSLNLINELYITMIKGNYNCDKTINLEFHKFEFIDSTPINNADIYHYSIKTPEICYLNLLENILSKGNTRTDRTQIGTISNFGNFIEFDIRNSIPLLTTKKVAWKTCIKELLWFLKGSTDANLLKKENVNIWNGNSSREFLDNRGLVHYKEGDIGPLYGFSWRHFGANYINCDTDYSGQGFDQIKYIENELINNPTSRRIYLSAWNPCDMNKCAIMPCHVSIQFYVEDNMLSSHVYMRSADTFLGLPFNIFSYAVLTYLFAKKTKLIPNKMCFSIGDAHIYNNHLDQVKMLLNRKPFGLPQLEINDNVINKDWNEITLDDFNLKNYVAHPSIKAEMAV